MKPLWSHSGSAGTLHGPPQPNSFFIWGSPLDYASYIMMEPKQNCSGHSRQIKNAKTLSITKSHAKAVSAVTIAAVEHVRWFAGYFGPAFSILIPQEAMWGKRRTDEEMEGWEIRTFLVGNGAGVTHHKPNCGVCVVSLLYCTSLYSNITISISKIHGSVCFHNHL